MFRGIFLANLVQLFSNCFCLCELSAIVFSPSPDQRNKLSKQRKAGSKFFHLLFSLSRLVATANICNVVLMRNHELFTGIEVKEKDGSVVGTSKIAARKVNIEVQNC